MILQEHALATGLPNKACPRLRDLATAPARGIKQPRTNLIREPCTLFPNCFSQTNWFFLNFLIRWSCPTAPARSQTTEDLDAKKVQEVSFVRALMPQHDLLTIISLQVHHGGARLWGKRSYSFFVLKIIMSVTHCTWQREHIFLTDSLIYLFTSYMYLTSVRSSGLSASWMPLASPWTSLCWDLHDHFGIAVYPLVAPSGLEHVFLYVDYSVEFFIWFMCRAW